MEEGLLRMALGGHKGRDDRDQREEDEQLRKGADKHEAEGSYQGDQHQGWGMGRERKCNSRRLAVGVVAWRCNKNQE